jgi:large subunit ribosomal protein L10
MNREQKAAVVDEIAEQLGAADAIFAVDYRGITVAQVANLRNQLREADARFRVVKNSLSERAADKAGLDDLKPMLVGPTALTLVHGDAAVAAKALNDLARRLNLLEFKGGLLNGAPLTADDVRSIARLPSREVLNGQFVATIAAPLTGLVRGLNALIAGVAIQLQAIVDMDPPVLVRGEAPAAEAAEPETAAAAAAAEPETGAAPEAAAAEPEPPESEATAAEPEPPEPEASAAEPEAAAAEPQPDAAAPEAPAAEPEAAGASEPAPTDQAQTETEAASDAEPSDE